MRIAIEGLSSLSGKNVDLTAAVVTTDVAAGVGALGLDEADSALLTAEAERVGFEPKLGKTVAILTKAGWQGLVGAADIEDTDYRRVGSAFVKLAQKLDARTGAVVGAESEAQARFLTEGVALTGYRFDQYISKKAEDEAAPTFTQAYIVNDFGAGVVLGEKLAKAVMAARDIANDHPGHCTPSFIAAEAEKVAEAYGFEIDVWDEARLEENGFNLLLAVGRGSVQPSRLIHMIYKGAGETKKKLAYVGKGVTYDSGGYSLKPSASQINMHLDMGGAAAVFGAAVAIGETQPEGVEIHFLIPSVENLVSDRAYKLNEIIKGYNGSTVEIYNTDAEGRLILADAIAYAATLEPDEIIDLATLTGACVVALGLEAAGVFSTSDDFAASFLESAKASDELMWHMPLSERLAGALKSDFADMKNVGPRWGGAITAAHFLRHFAGDVTWLHVDLAGPAMAEKPWEYINQGGTGFGVLALHDYAVKSGRQIC